MVLLYVSQDLLLDFGLEEASMRAIETNRSEVVASAEVLQAILGVVGTSAAPGAAAGMDAATALKWDAVLRSGPGRKI
jgi:hypothetical protein